VGLDPRPSVVVQLRQSTRRLRLLTVHADTVAPGAKWSSGEWVLTPHRSAGPRASSRSASGCATTCGDGIHCRTRPRRFGYRTVWMCQNQPEDPTDAVWRFTDLPELPVSRDHGLTEMVLWARSPVRCLAARPFRIWEPKQELLEAVRACRKLGVNVAPFISVIQASPKTAGRYGLKIRTTTAGRTTPSSSRLEPALCHGLSCVQVGPANQSGRTRCRGLPALGRQGRSVAGRTSNDRRRQSPPCRT